jgi:hypothetical protein
MLALQKVLFKNKKVAEEFAAIEAAEKAAAEEA